ncbi:glutathione S-transferase family protein [Dokdonella soli]|uniref:GST N-terminal domain-containing protein n=1 Tax=Dokdonella soli TaxID=529810 RepID=A0ABN1ILS3_9GAMM
MIDLYKLHWSHYVEKVRWALDFKRLAWRGIEVVAFTKQEMQRFDCSKTVPLIHDNATGVAMSDSSPIIRYLEETYPEPTLLSADPDERAAVWQWMLTLDSTLGLNTRRLAYSQIIMECPQALPTLFLPNVLGGVFARPGLRVLAAPILGAMLVRRFRFDRNRIDRVYEQLETQLLPIAARLERDGFLVGGRFTAADLTLASLLRPLRVVPHFRDHPRLQSLFAWQAQLFDAHGREATFAYEDIIRVQRERCGTMRGRVGWLTPDALEAAAPTASETLQVARNDQHHVDSWSLPLGLPGYLKLRWFSGVGRVRYAPAALHGVG